MEDKAAISLGCLKCKSKTVPVGTCSAVTVKVCGCIHHFHLKYKATATETKSGKSASFEYSDSGKTAAAKALVNLFNELSEPGACNCATGSTAIGRCTLPYRACFYFLDENQLNNKQSDWKGFVDGAANEGMSTGETSPQNAVASAVVDFAKLNGAFMANCEKQAVRLSSDVGMALVNVTESSMVEMKKFAMEVEEAFNSESEL